MMREYHKIQTVYKRDDRNKLLEGDFSLPEFGYLCDAQWVWTEKVDGTNIRVMWDGKEVTFNGKTDNAQIPAFLVKRLQDLFMLQGRDALFPATFTDANGAGVCLYGEGYGARIQKGGGNYKADGVDFVLFDVKVGEWWLPRDAVEQVAGAFGIQAVPIIGSGTISQMVDLACQGFQSCWGDFAAEGIVAKPAVELRTRQGDRIITKIKHKDF